MQELIYIGTTKHEIIKKYSLEFLGWGKYKLTCGVLAYGKIHFFYKDVDIKELKSISITDDLEMDWAFGEYFNPLIEEMLCNLQIK